MHAAPAAGPRWWRSRRVRITAVALLLGSAAFWWMLPRPLFREPFSAVLLARDGSLLGARIAADGQWRFPELAAVPQRFALALMHYEDPRFRHHPGIDPLAVARAMRSNWRAQRVVSGASTLTMQLARQIIQQDGTRRRGYLAKAWQALLALRLECRYSKDELLALYASHAPFGGNVVGLEAAAWRYFGRDPSQLSWAEAATLAVLPNAPGLVTPGRGRQRLQSRRDALLRTLARHGLLPELDLQLALAEPLVAAPQPLPDAAPHLLETLRARYPRQHRFASTLDAQLQRAASRQVAELGAQLQRSGIGNAAALIVDNRSFEVLAYVGNAGWGFDPQRALAVDIVQRPRSTGSILKPFLYAAMLDSGQLLPRMLVPDVPTQIRGFTPENFDRGFRGAVPADEALAHSLNVPAVRLLRDFGYPRFHELLQQLGFSTLARPPDHYGLALILGGAEATLWDVTQAYAELADTARGAGGMARRLEWLRGPAAAAPSRPQPRPLSAGAAWLAQQALLEVARPAEEANWKRFADSRLIAWKTGTSWGLRDAWAVGSTTAHTVGVWVGNADGSGVPGLTGSSAAAPLLFALHDNLPRSPWYATPMAALKSVHTCSDDGYLASELCDGGEELVPLRSHFDRQTPYHQLVHLDRRDQLRVNSDCAAVATMIHQPWFVLPPTLEYYYRTQHGDYRPLPAWRAGCRERAEDGARGAMEFLYPDAGGRIYVPVTLDGSRGRAVLEVMHRDPRAQLYWHLDDDYAGRTELHHQLAVDLAPGRHRVTVVDASGRRLSRDFEVLTR
ncbi:MAG: penicillin-binding protein 1C [Steroidobacteraceae bacterium]